MGINSCDICACIPANMDARFFYQAAINLLCQIQANTDISDNAVIRVSNAEVYGTPALAVGIQFLGFDVIEAGSTSTVLNLTAHVALPGDVIRFPAVAQAGTTSRQWATVLSVTANTVTLAQALSFTPVAGQDISISRDVPIGAYGSNSTGLTSMNANINIDAQQSQATGILKAEDSASASGDAGVFSLFVRNTAGTTMAGTEQDYSGASVNQFGMQYAGPSLINMGSADIQYGILKAEDAPFASGDAGVFILGVRNDGGSVLAGNGDYQGFTVNSIGALEVSLNSAYQLGASGGSSPIRNEDTAFANGNATMVAGQVRYDTPTADNADLDVAPVKGNDVGALYTDGVRRSTFTHTQPTVTNITSFTLVASNTARRYLRIQNNSAANIMVNLNNGTLTDIVPTSTNLGMVLAAGAVFETPPNACPTAAVTVYQSSGGSINTISVIEA